MSTIETLSDVNNTFLSRRELTCDFPGSSGKLKSMEAVDMVTKEFKLDGKVVIPMRLKTHVGMSKVTGTFYVYEDEGLAKKHINPTIFSRLEKTKAKIAEAEKAAEDAAAEAPAEDAAAEAPAEDAAAEAPAEDAAAEAPAEDAAAEAP
ncbi:MAG: 30S ribosomal protein S24e, partial [Nitrosopumilus sp.]